MIISLKINDIEVHLDVTDQVTHDLQTSKSNKLLISKSVNYIHVF